MTALTKSQINEEADFRMSDGEEDLGSSNAGSDDESADNGHADSEDDGDDENEVDTLDGAGNVGWANTFAKVLQQDKPKAKKYLVLSKAKKLADKKANSEKTTKSFNFEIQDGKGVKTETSDDEEKPSNEELEELAIIAARKERNNKLLALRVKPSVMDRERERTFKRIATKGLVQLFNAVRSQQKDLVDKLEKAGPLDHRRDAVLNNINKKQFLDVLMGGKRAKSENVDNLIKDEEVKDEEDASTGKESQWSVLRDDFMTNRKLTSHWDNDEDNEDDQNGGPNQSADESMEEE